MIGMPMQEYKQIIDESVQVKRTAHIFKLGNVNASCKWLITHGYAMTGDQVLKKFRNLDLESNYFISAEGLSSFYWRGEGKQLPVSSWMTSRYRLDEISDYADYLDLLYKRIAEADKRIFFGFSQGGTTFWRYINDKKPEFDIFINWAGDIPPDSVYDKAYLKTKRFIYIHGTNDQYMDQELLSRRKAFAEELSINIEYLEYEGDHRVYPEVLSKIKI